MIITHDLQSWNDDDDVFSIIKYDSVYQLGYCGVEWDMLYATSHMETCALFHVAGDALHAWGDVRNGNTHTTFCLVMAGMPVCVWIDHVHYIVSPTYDKLHHQLYLITGSRSGDVHILHAGKESLSPISVLRGHTDMVRSSCWMGQELVTAAEDGRVLCWSFN